MKLLHITLCLLLVPLAPLHAADPNPPAQPTIQLPVPATTSTNVNPATAPHSHGIVKTAVHKLEHAVVNEIHHLTHHKQETPDTTSVGASTNTEPKTKKHHISVTKLAEDVFNLTLAHNTTSQNVTTVTTQVSDPATGLPAAHTRLTNLEDTLHVKQLKQIMEIVNKYGPILGKTATGHTASQLGLVTKLLDKTESMLPTSVTNITNVIGTLLTKDNINVATTSALVNGVTTTATGSPTFDVNAALKNGASHLITLVSGNALSMVATKLGCGDVLNVSDLAKTGATMVASTLIHAHIFG